MATEEVTINGNTVWRDTNRPHRWYDAIGPDVCKLVEDFVDTEFSAADQMAAWLATLIEDGAGESTVALVGGSAGGEVVLTADIGDNDGINAQLLGEAFYLAARYPTYFGARFKAAEVIQCDLALGLVITDATFLLSGTTDGLYFRSPDGVATLQLVAEKDSAETVIGVATLAANTYVTVEYLFWGGILYIYVNGVQVAELADSDPNFPDDEYLTPTIALLTGEITNVKTLTVDWINCIQIQSV